MREHGSICYHCYHEFRALPRARAVLIDEVGVAAAVSAMTVDAGASVKRADATLLCFQCNQTNHRESGRERGVFVVAPIQFIMEVRHALLTPQSYDVTVYVCTQSKVVTRT